MRRTMTISAAAAIVLALAAPMAVSAATADRSSGLGAVEPASPAAIPQPEVIRLGCKVRSADTGVAVKCRWSEPASARAAVVKLFRLDPAVDPHRQVIYRSKNVSRTTFTDTEVRSGHRYHYAVVLYDANGRVVARSRVERVRIPRLDDSGVEVLKLACQVADSAEWIGCRWRKPLTADAAVVSLWRSVDGGRRELVEQFRPSGPHAYRDAVPEGAVRVKYVVTATTKSDRIVARSRAVTVRIPQIDLRPVDTRPVDRRLSDARSVGVVAP